MIVPVADAVEQPRSTADPVPDEEAPEEPAGRVPLEPTDADSHERRETVDLDPALEEFDPGS